MKNSKIPPAVFIGCLYRIHFVLCLKLADVHANEIN